MIFLFDFLRGRFRFGSGGNDTVGCWLISRSSAFGLV
jgi:hypothetical protein